MWENLFIEIESLEEELATDILQFLSIFPRNVPVPILSKDYVAGTSLKWQKGCIIIDIFFDGHGIFSCFAHNALEDLLILEHIIIPEQSTKDITDIIDVIEVFIGI